MKNRLGEFEQLLLFALLRLGDDAYGVTIRRDIERRTSRPVSVGAVYTALQRLEDRGLVKSHVGEPTRERGGRRKRFYHLEPAGTRALSTSYHTLLSILAITLAAVGLFGVVAFTVAARTRELGARIAMGAEPRSVLGLVLRRGLVLIGLGLGTGLVGAVALSKVIESRLVGVATLDPPIYLAAVLILTGVALGATLVPVRRATRVDPIAALRCE